MRRRFSRSAGRKPRRSVAWIPGFSCFDDVGSINSRELAFAGPLPGTTSTWSVAVVLTIDADLSMHGGEDAVLERIRGRMCFAEGLHSSGGAPAAIGFPLRVAVYQAENLPSAAFDQAITRSPDMGNDSWLWSSEGFCSSIAEGATGTGIDAIPQAAWFDIDVRAKRRVQSNSPIVMTMQTCAPAGTTSLTMRMLGGARILLKRPR